jgi:enterochelin esterase family protein
MPLAQILIPGEGWTKVDAELSKTPAHHRTVTAANFAYTINDDRRSLRVSGIAEPSKAVVQLPVKEASALAVTPDKGTLMVGDAADKYVWLFRIEKDGKLTAGEKYITLRVLPYVAPTLRDGPKVEPRSETSAIDFDKAGRTYVATKFGVQVFDPTGRLCGVLTSPSTKPITSMALGGADGDRLFIACGNEVYGRKLNAKGAFFEENKKK